MNLSCLAFSASRSLSRFSKSVTTACKFSRWKDLLSFAETRFVWEFENNSGKVGAPALLHEAVCEADCVHTCDEGTSTDGILEDIVAEAQFVVAARHVRVESVREGGSESVSQVCVFTFSPPKKIFHFISNLIFSHF